MSCTLGYHSDASCAAVGVWTDPDLCHTKESIDAICSQAAAVEQAAGCGDEAGAGGVMWGMIMSLVGDVVISIGLALQKVGLDGATPHTRAPWASSGLRLSSQTRSGRWRTTV